MDSIFEWLKYIFLGLLQGFTEPIPVSSSGHVVLAQHWLGLHISGLGFEVLVNFASLIAVLLIYRHDLLRLIAGAWAYIRHKDKDKQSEFRFALYLVVGTIPAAILGVLFNDFIGEELKGIRTIAITLILTGIALWFIRKKIGDKHDKDLTFKDALIVGLAQAVALIPGISRSGATIVAAMARGMKRGTALRYSFFLYIPVSLGSLVLEGSTLVKDMSEAGLWLPYLLAFIASLIASYYSLRWFMGVMERGKLHYFTLYCLIVGVAVLLFNL